MSEEKLQCGIVMPISAIDGCNEAHWADVLEIINEAIDESGFDGELVSNADDVGIIHKRIIQNLYENPIVVCDVSGKNPNVMFELGMRLAFDKPTIIIKDDKTTYSFDTSAIEHLEYPRDLRFTKVVEFKKKLADKLKATYKKASEDPNYTTFLKHFGEFKVAKIDQKEVSGQEFIIEELKSMRRSINRLDRMGRNKYDFDRYMGESDIDICLGDFPASRRDEAIDLLMKHPAVKNAGMVERGEGHYHLVGSTRGSMEGIEIEREVSEMLGVHNMRNRKIRKNIVEAG
ncbi:hypothetical protein [Thiomicrorhabdus sp. Kp2]|uniref:hypothetical protein n=1 Tax=Thiomicrorhabdus sp. Kp2 TaxID=1123518 RepID=UPI00041DDA0B|nr:hypothetical protein [Thiomicrorhabdus sp. Kp2]